MLELVAGLEVAGRAVDQVALVGVDQHLRRPGSGSSPRASSATWSWW